MKLKTVTVGDQTFAVLDDKGMPVYVYDDGKEAGFDAVATSTRISALNREAQGHREEKEQLAGKLKAFEGIEDPDAARNALGTVKNLQSGELKTAAQIEEIKREARKAAEEQVAQATRQLSEQLKEKETTLSDLTTALFDEKVGGAFARSKFVSEKTAVPADMLRNQFGKHFKIENGNIVPYGADGQKLYSSTRPGEIADFEEGLETLVNHYPYKSQILKGTGNSGTGARQGQGGQTQVNGKPAMLRSQFEQLGATERAAAIKTHAVVDTL
jgi:hypothetical protein